MPHAHSSARLRSHQSLRPFFLDFFFVPQVVSGPYHRLPAEREAIWRFPVP
jgi:hypothetical protein